jgi:cytochrome c biogenesis protein CcmG, thiol:disulfide interchange protein DsbE
MLIRHARGLCALLLAMVAAGASPVLAASAADPLDLAALRGKVVYVDFWASWCEPCRQSFPWMNDMQREFAKDGLVVIAVNLDHERADAEQFLRKYTPDFRISYDPDGAVAERFHVKGMPTSFLVDRAGKIQLQHAGFRSKDRAVLEQQIRGLLAVQ